MFGLPATSHSNIHAFAARNCSLAGEWLASEDDDDWRAASKNGPYNT